MTSAKYSDFFNPPIDTVTFTQPPLLSSGFWGPPPPFKCGRHKWKFRWRGWEWESKLSSAPVALCRLTDSDVQTAVQSLRIVFEVASEAPQDTEGF